MRRASRYCRHGFALMTVLFFLAFAFGAWAIFYHSSASALRLQEARAMRDTRTTWTAPAIAAGLRLLQTGNPPSDPYSCKVTIASDSETHYILLTFDQITLGRYTLTASPTTADDPTHSAPSTFLPVPDAPTNLVATAASSTQINLTWADVTNETGYLIERSLDNSTWTQVGTAVKNATNYSDTGLTAATLYYYRIRATNSTGNGAYSAVASTSTLQTAPPAPGGLGATAVSASEIDLSWNDVSNETGYSVERSPDGSSNWTQLNINAPNVTTYSDTGLSSGVTYYYRVRAFNLAGNSAYTSVVSATTIVTIPNAPSSLVATAVSNTEIDLTWADNSTNETGFKVERSPNGTSSWTQIATPAAGATSYNNTTGLTANTTYYYRVRATNSAGDSSYSNIANTATLPNAPSAPSALAAAASDSSDIALTWTDNSTNETGFKIERSPDASTWTQITTVGAGVTSFTDSGLAVSTKYYYRVRAYNSGGKSGYTGTANATTTAKPAIPTGLTAAVASPTSVQLTWTDNSNNETGFRIQISSNGGSTWTTATTTGANVTSYTDSGLTTNHAYQFRIRLNSSNGSTHANSSAPVSVTPH